MRLSPSRLGHLSYCTNIHAGETWDQVYEQLRMHLPPLRQRLARGARFGIGLRLSAVAAETLAAVSAREEFRDWLDTNGLYVFTLNGFPYGRFHGTPVKEQVYRPDWRTRERLDYSNRLADILAALVPEGGEGSISTLPAAYKEDVAGDRDLQAITENLLAHVAHLVDLRARTGRVIRLGLEPEPFCLLETRDQVLAFFAQRLHSVTAARRLSDLAGLGLEGAAKALREHLGVCLDACHAAVEFEEPAETARAWADAGIRIVKIQVSSALRLPNPGAEGLSALAEFNDAVYLHQTVSRQAEGSLSRYLDIPQALGAGAGDSREWRIHFHVPVFREDLGRFKSTTPQLRRLLALHRQCPLTPHLEVETYSFGVLPPEHRTESVLDNIARELEWTRGQLTG